MPRKDDEPKEIKSRVRYIGQRQYGIIAPNRDVQRVDKLIVGGMAPCFAISLVDRVNQVGFLTHIDYEDDFSLLLRRTVTELRFWGGEKFKLHTANIASDQLSSDEITHRIEVVNNFARTLIDEDILIPDRDTSLPGVVGWRDLGITQAAVLDFNRGLKTTLNIKREGLSAFQITEAEKYSYELLDAFNFGKPPIMCRYRPVGKK